MSPQKTSGYAFNVTRQSLVASRLSVANTHLRRLIGLMGTTKQVFSSGSGLWIVPCHGVHTIGMRYPIDVIYLDEKKRVIRVEENVRPWRVTPMVMESASLIELPAHTAFDTGTQVGDELEIKITEAA